MRQKRLERFWTANGGPRSGEPHGWGEQRSSPPVSRLELCARPDKTPRRHLTNNPRDGVSTKTSGTFLNGEAGPKGGGQEARNKVVHCTRIQNQSALKIPNGRPEGTPLQAIAAYLDLCKSTQIQTDT
jgi:hypothetical protein